MDILRDTMEQDMLQNPQNREISPGDHICVLLHDDEEARATLLTRLFQDAFLKGWKVLYLARSSSPEYLKGLFRTGAGTSGASSRNAVEILSSDDPAFHRAFSDSANARNFMKTAILTAGQENFSSLCIIREVPPIPYQPRSSQRVTSDTAGIEKLLDERQITLICLYEMSLFPSEVLQDVLRTHPKAIIEGEMTENIFYIPSSDARRYSLSSLELGHWIRTLLNLTHIRAELEESEARFHDLLENANDLIQSVDPEGKFLFTNRAWRERLGYDQSDIAGLNLFDILDPSCVDKCRSIFTKVMEGCAMERIDTVFRTRTGEKVYVEGNVNCRIYHGKPVYTRGIFRETGKSPSASKIKTQILEQILDTIQEEIIAVDGKGEILYANRAARKMAGGPGGEMDRITGFSDIFPPGEGQSAMRRLIEPVRTGELPAGIFVTMRDGSNRIMETNNLRIPDQPSGTRLVLFKTVK
jgi:PAS domain S-box-containing protein